MSERSDGKRSEEAPEKSRCCSSALNLLPLPALLLPLLLLSPAELPACAIDVAFVAFVASIDVAAGMSQRSPRGSVAVTDKASRVGHCEGGENSQCGRVCVGGQKQLCGWGTASGELPGEEEGRCPRVDGAVRWGCLMVGQLHHCMREGGPGVRQ